MASNRRRRFPTPPIRRWAAPTVTRFPFSRSTTAVWYAPAAAWFCALKLPRSTRVRICEWGDTHDETSTTLRTCRTGRANPAGSGRGEEVDRQESATGGRRQDCPGRPEFRQRKGTQGTA